MYKIVIIGGGFAGINMVRQLSGKKGFEVTLVDRNNYNFFPPLLYQLATGFLEPSNICYPFRKILQKHRNISFRMGELLALRALENKVILSTGELHYDFLVFATGTETNYFGMENIRVNALPMKTVNDSLALRNHFLETMELAEITTDEKEMSRLLTIVIAGGGPTGVEVSGMLSDLKRSVIPKDYPAISGRGYDSHIYLVDSGTAVLGPMSIPSQTYTYDALTNMGVEIKLGVHVTDFKDGQVTLSSGEKIGTRTLVWAAGVSAQLLDGVPVESYGRGKRMLVDAYNKVCGLENVYAVGDTCLLLTDPGFPSGHPQLAQVAIQQGINLAANFSAIYRGKKLTSFTYKDRGTMAIIGRNKAVADLTSPALRFNGFVAWFIWVFVHLFSLISYRNRIKTLYNWVGAYFTKDQSLRLIIKPGKDKPIQK